VKDIRPNIVREHGKIILDLLKFLPEQAEWPLRMARPIRHSSQDIGSRVDTVIQRAVQETSVPKEVLMRKKWLNACISMWFFIMMNRIYRAIYWAGAMIC
jgi:hypothetical protein